MGKMFQARTKGEKVKKKPINNEKYFREINQSEIKKSEDEERIFELSFSSEVPYKRFFGYEILDHSESSVDLKRLKDVGCVLFNHDRNRVIAKILDAWIEDNKGRARIQFDEDADADTIFKKVQAGTLSGVSIGYIVNTWEEIPTGKKSKDGRFMGPCYVAKDWYPYEISIVSVPADPTVGVGRSVEEDEGQDGQGRTLDWFIRQHQIMKSKGKKEENE